MGLARYYAGQMEVERGESVMTEQNKAGIRAPRVVRQKLRSAAIARVRQDIIHAGRTEEDYDTEDLEYLVAEKEKEIWAGVGLERLRHSRTASGH